MLDARRRIAIVTLILAAAAAAGCSDINPFESTSTTAQPRQRPADANDADVEFLTDMAEHLQRGRALTNAALDSSANAGDDVATLAGHIEDEDAGRVVKMTELLESWGEATVPSTPTDEVDELAGLDGVEFVDQWAALMLEHHDWATALAERVKRDGSSRVVNNLAAGMLVDLAFDATTIESI